MIIWKICGNDDFGDDVSDEGYGAVPPPFISLPSSLTYLNPHPTTTVSVLSHSSILPASRGY